MSIYQIKNIPSNHNYVLITIDRQTDGHNGDIMYLNSRFKTNITSIKKKKINKLK